MKVQAPISTAANIDTQAKRVILVVAIFSLWAALGIVAAYKKPWLGNRQELYPTIILPGFGRNSAKTSEYLYTRYLLRAFDKDGQVTELQPASILGSHWVAKMDSLIAADRAERLDGRQAWVQKLPPGTKRIEFVIQTRSFLAGPSSPGPFPFPR